MLINPAFEFLRKHKKVSPETEALVMKRVAGRVSSSDLISVFEKGISGDFGKVYSADPETILGWVKQWESEKNKSRNYLSTGLLPVDTPVWEVVEWDKEANKCFTAHISGISEAYFHPGVYDRMMIDGKINLNDCMKYLPKGYKESDVMAAKQKVLRDVFSEYKQKGWNKIYFV